MERREVSGWRGEKERNEFERRKIDEQKIRLFNGEMEEKAFVSKSMCGYVMIIFFSGPR